MKGLSIERARGPLLSAAIVLLAFDLLAFLSGEAPASALSRALAGTWGTPYGFGQVLYKTTPLLFTGVAFEVAYRAGLFNIGTEGQMALGALAAGTVAAALPAGVPWPVGVPLVLLAAVAAGGLWGALAGVLRARRGAHEVIVTILQNRLVDALLPYALAHGLGAGGFRTPDGAPGTRILRLERLVPSLSGSAVSLAFALAVGAVFAGAFAMKRTRAGRESRWVGLGPQVAAAQGVKVGRRIVQAMAVSGALSGLAASALVSGYKGYFELGVGAGAGFGGIAVALLGRGDPWGMLASALLVGTLQQAGLVLNASLPKEAMDVLFGVAILVAASRPPVAAPGGLA